MPEEMQAISEFLELKDDPELLKGTMKLVSCYLEDLQCDGTIELSRRKFIAAKGDLTPKEQALCLDPAKWRVAVKMSNLEILRGCHLYAMKKGLLIGSKDDRSNCPALQQKCTRVLNELQW
jgi:hypothetical protein